MKPRHLLLIGSLAAIAVSVVSTGMAFANDRYATQPPVKVSRQAAAPWVAQLQSPTSRIDPQTRPALRQKPATLRQKQQPRARYQNVSQQRPAANPVKTVRKKQLQMDPVYLPQTVSYSGREKPGTIVIDTNKRFLYLVEGNGQARRYGVGVGKQGFGWKGTQRVSRKAEWPTWTPPKAMIERERKKGRILPAQMKGGANNPLGARALYLGSTLYRIHGTNQPWTIGKAMSSGCFRMRNEDVTDLYNRVGVGTHVVVR
ncbi:L,D-transpeptidase [Falsochrobactrum shanghaiense]|uniref:L,D-transpeptidase n=1 Tax=Falsochrobactrum shanghaiense TaxID=2201899 RepID=A0A316J806_9HYPH|nr:L,D-transpeptidase [Falsochrobactrum shanghaiense]PWL17476.1 L,D-transpeptidase [Falsochrobactrum shanghaiense]